MKEEYRRYLHEGQVAGSHYALVVPRNVPRGVTGAQMGMGVGSSLEFMDHREYQPGDDLRRINWNAYARTDRLTVKMYREEVNPHVDIVLDGSRSMALPETPKVHAALALAAVFAESGANAGYRTCSWITGSWCERIHNGTERAAFWEAIDFDSKTNPGQALSRMQGRFAAQGMRVFISDLLWLGDPLVCLNRLAQKASSVFVIQLLTRADVQSSSRGNIRLVDSETNETKELFIDAATGKRYQQRLTEHQNNWHRACTQVGALMTTLIADDVVDRWHLDELVATEILQVL